MIAINQAKRAVGAICAEQQQEETKRKKLVRVRERGRRGGRGEKAKPLDCRHVSKQTYQRLQLAVV